MNLKEIEAEQNELQRLLAENRVTLERLGDRTDALHAARVRADHEAEGIQIEAWLAIDDATEYGLMLREPEDSFTAGDLCPALLMYVADMARLHGYGKGEMLARLVGEDPGTRPEFDALFLLTIGGAR